MITGISTASLSGTLEQKLEAAAEAEFDGVTIAESDLISSALAPAAIRVLADLLELEIHGYSADRAVETFPPEDATISNGHLAIKLDLAAQLGSPFLVLYVDTSRCDSVGLIDTFARLGGMAEDRNVRVALIPSGGSKSGSQVASLGRLIQSAGNPAIGIGLDTHRLLLVGARLEEALVAGIDHIFAAHLAELTREEFAQQKAAPFDVPRFISALDSLGFAGPLTIAASSGPLRQAAPGRAAMDAERSLLFWRDEAARLTESNVLGSGDALADGGPAVGFNFVEINVGYNAELERMLAGVGLQRIGTHRNKQVDLWVAGNVRLVLNHGEGTAADVRLSAVGFNFSEPSIAATRAWELLAPTVQRTSQPDEEKMWAVRAPNGEEIYFCSDPVGREPHWVAEFGRDIYRASSRPTDVAIDWDHVSLPVPWDALDESTRFYRSVLGFELHGSTDVSDPSSVVRSQVLQSPDGGIHLVLNGAANSKSSLAHIAFACEDLVSMVSDMAERGIPLLEIPANYYADLRSRFDIDDALADELERLNIMYDADEHGRFFQAYSSTVGGLFLEFIQRSGDYAGFGAANSPVRRTAQLRASQRTRAN